MSLKDILSTPIGGKADEKPGKKKDRKSVGKKGVKIGKKSRKPSARNLPVKRSINLATTGEKPIQAKTAIPAIVLIIVAAILLSKFFVVDRLMDMYRAQSEVSSLQSQLADAYRQLSSFGSMTDEYAHYTYTGMTSEEMTRTDRGAVMDLLQRTVLPQASMSSWSLNGSILTLNIARGSLQDINSVHRLRLRHHETDLLRSDRRALPMPDRRHRLLRDQPEQRGGTQRQRHRHLLRDHGGRHLGCRSAGGYRRGSGSGCQRL